MQHKNLGQDDWSRQSLVFQLANIGSEVFRAMQWKHKNNLPYAHDANLRALELFDLTLSSTQKLSELKEIARARELWLDFFVGDNQYKQTEQQWKNYFYAFTYAAQNKK